MTLPLTLYTASQGGNMQIASVTAIVLLVPSVTFMLLVERWMRADVLAQVGR
jgi:ABC-type Fe3+ transport system permease subunit